MLILNSDEVRQALPMRPLIEAMKAAYASLSAGTAIVPLRSRLPIESRQAAALFMPAYIPGSGPAAGGEASPISASSAAGALGVKIVTLFPGNPARGLPFIHAAVLVMDPENGRMLALMEGGTLTALRTGAGAGAATDLLARPEARTAAMIGSGRQAQTQLLAVCAVRRIEAVRVYSPNPANVKTFIERMSVECPAEYHAARTPAEALDGADVICTATTAISPVFADRDLPPGAHINGVGSYSPDMVEIPPETLARARITVDSRSACAAEAGELIRAIELGLVDPQSVAEIGEVVLGRKPGRVFAEEITLFKSVGVAVQDAAAAALALERARALGLGSEVDW